MTNAKRREYREKYPVGTKVKYIGYSGCDETGDVGKIGTIVNFYNETPLIFLPNSNHVSIYSTSDIPASWLTLWTSLEILPIKGQQLMFEFMA